jgi:hypothetical protein
VDIAHTQNNEAAIAGGISPGDLVVTDGQDKLQAGSKVEMHGGPAGANRQARNRGNRPGSSSAQPESAGTPTQ